MLFYKTELGHTPIVFGRKLSAQYGRAYLSLATLRFMPEYLPPLRRVVGQLLDKSRRSLLLLKLN